MTLTQLLAGRRHLLLDFDGPVCTVFGGIPADHIARHYAALLREKGIPLPAAVDDTDDPFDILRTAATAEPASAPFAERTLRDLELHAITSAPMTVGITEALTALNDTGHTVAIVSNNSTAAVRAFLDRHDLHALVRDVVGRTEPDPALLKPNPHLLLRAMAGLHADPNTCVLLGDSTTDITAAHTADVPVIAYANRAGKRAAFADHSPEVVIDTISAIADALQQLPAR